MKKLFFHFKYSLACAIAYCIPAFFLFESGKYSNAWLLYLGNFCFAIILITGNVLLNNRKPELQTLRPMITTALKIELKGIVITCVLLLALVFIFHAGNILKHEPANVLGLYIMLPLNAVIINLAVGGICIFFWVISAKKKEA